MCPSTWPRTMGLVLITPPTDAPITTAEVIEHLRLEEDPPQDDLLRGLVGAARGVVEHRTGRVLMPQRWRLTLDEFPWDILEIPKSPLRSIASITYVDQTGTTRTLSPGAYQVDISGIRGRIAPAYGTRWPSTRCQLSAVAIEFDAGYKDQAKVPDDIKAAMLLLIASYYENREAVIVGTIVNELPHGVSELLAPHTIVDIV